MNNEDSIRDAELNEHLDATNYPRLQSRPIVLIDYDPNDDLDFDNY